MNKRSESTPRLVESTNRRNERASDVQSSEGSPPWLQPVLALAAVSAASFAAVKLGQQPDGANKLKGFAGVISAVAMLSKVT